MLAAIGVPSPLQGRSSGEGSIGLRIGAPESLDVDARVKIVLPPGAPPGSFPIEGEGALRISGRTVTFDAPAARTRGTTAGVHVEKVLATPSTTLRLDATTDSLAETARLLDAFLAVQRTPPHVPWDADKLAGHGRIEGQVIFTEGRTVRGEGTFDLRDFSYESIGAGSVSGSGRADGSRFVLSNVFADKQGGHAELEGNWPEGGEGGSRIAGRFERWPVEDLLARLGAPAGTTVRVDGTLTRTDGPEGAGGGADFSLSEGIFLGASFTSGRFTATLTGPILESTNFTLKGPDAAIGAQGSYDTDARRLLATVDGTGIDLALLRERLGDLHPEGHAGANLRVRTDPSGTSWSLMITPSPDLKVVGHPVEDFALRAEGDGSVARFTGALGSVADFRGTVALADPYAGEGTIALRSVPLPGLLALAGSTLAERIDGDLSGQVTWSGPLGTPERLKARLDLFPVRIAVGTARDDEARQNPC